MDQQNREIAHELIVITRVVRTRPEVATIWANNFQFATHTSRVCSQAPFSSEKRRDRLA
jgi:hypothetical protein